MDAWMQGYKDTPPQSSKDPKVQKVQRPPNIKINININMIGDYYWGLFLGFLY